MAVCTEIIARHKPEEIYFLFSSQGGSVHAGIALYNFLRALPTRIVMHNIAQVDSIATALFLAGEKRYAAPQSKFLFHGIKLMFEGRTVLQTKDIKEHLSNLDGLHNLIAEIITDRTKIKRDEILRLFDQGEAKDLSFAVEKGVVHEIQIPQVPKDAPLISLNIE